jgi:hypothetical protein
LADPIQISRKSFLGSILVGGGAGFAAPRAQALARPGGGRPRGVTQVLNVRDEVYGAAGDGVADDTLPIQRAINDAAVQGHPIYLPSGRYRVARLFFHHHPALNPGFTRVPGREGNVSLFGDGPVTRASLVHDELQRTVIESDDPLPPIELDGEGLGYRLKAVSIGDLTVRANNATQAIRLFKANTFVNLTNLQVRQAGPGGGILAEDTWVDTWMNLEITGEDAHLTSPASKGLVIRNVSVGGGNLVLINVSVLRFGTGWEIGHVDPAAAAQVIDCVTCFGCHASRSSRVGVLVGKGAKSVNWIGCHVENASNAAGDAAGMQVKNFAQGINVTGAWFSGCDTAVRLGDTSGREPENTARAVTIQGSNLVNCRRFGLRVHATPSSGRFSIENNTFTADPSTPWDTTGIALDDADLHGVTLRYNRFPSGGSTAFDTDVANPRRADVIQDPGRWTFQAASPVLSGTWDGSHLVMGAHHLWVGPDGRLRIHDQPPKSATDGKLVSS